MNRWCVHPLASLIAFLFQVLVKDTLLELKGWWSHVLSQGMTRILLDLSMLHMGDAGECC